MAIAVTSTVNLVFGSQVLDPVTGVLMNDEVCLFSTLVCIIYAQEDPRWTISRLQA